jgi:hypothetical protein
VHAENKKIKLLSKYAGRKHSSRMSAGVCRK